MNKTNYLILTILLCFSIAFVVYPIKANALSDEAQAMIDDLKEKYPEEEEEEEEFDLFSEFRTDPSDPTGTPGYDIAEEDPSGTEGPLPADVGAIYIPVVEPTQPKPDKPDDNGNGNGNGANGNGANGGNGGCTEEEPPVEEPPAVEPPPVSPPPVSPPPVSPPPVSPPPVSPPPVSPPPVSPPPVSPPPVSPPPTPPEPSPCMINYFELPERAWVGYPITGRWSASADCDDCDVDCIPYPECVWKQDSIGTGFDEYRFTIEQSGNYNYTLTCYGQGGMDERTETATVEALNLPWWREIIPVLPGFLRGIFR